MKKQWWKESVVYQIYPRSFMDSNGDGIGDLQGIISRLDYLKELGIDVVWLSPVYKSPNDDNGYDISDYQDIMSEFGTMEDWEELLGEMHKREIKLIMDLVVNHSSDEHIWFAESRKSKDNPFRDYYIWREGRNGKEPNNWGSNFGGSAWKLDDKTGEYYLHLFSKKQPDLNWDNPKLRNEIYDMMTWWLEKGIDGFRMDVVNFISKVEGLPDDEPKPGKKYASGSKYYRNGPRIHEYLREMNEKALAKFNVMTVGEMPGVTPEWARQYTGESRNELNMVFQFEHVSLDNGPNGKWDLKPLDLCDLKLNLTKWQNELDKAGWNSLYFNNHDQPRSVSRFGNDGEYREKSAKMLATLLHMMKGTPYVYQGEEIGMTNVRFSSVEEYRDIETLNFYKEALNDGWTEDKALESIYAKGRDNARTPMQWDSSEHGGFSDGTPWIKVNPNYKDINVEKAMKDPDSVFHYYKKLIELRKKNEIIVYGRYNLILDQHPEVYAYTRTLGNQILLVLCNFYGGNPEVEPPAYIQEKKFEALIGNYKDIQINRTIKLRPYEAQVLLFNS
ncbi:MULTISPECIES: glycoside hydrolase family 13 protein [Cytobacillus]|uniref:oligo-1,6-glucosidase n=2 Tax=Cytobacillus oceanisediminis TaxID=665099 RepID=A0A160M9M1_9BACI|nr:alpha-glucosidase [Cytobacillus oceanisediminis]AND39103.1 glucohydrolase [Cytobacillus oceanisediminis 2691]OHX38893.1 glucohydrolase [Cytobacillus oceanisediminis]